jgi:hypothetical protein
VIRALALAFVLFFSVNLHAAELDIFDHPVAAQLGGDRPVLVLYANRETREATGKPAAEMALRLHDLPYVTLVRVDLRGIPSLFEGFALRNMRSAYQENIERSRRLYREAGYPPPAALGHNLVFVGDSKGTAHAAVGLGKDFPEALAIVLDPKGKEILRAAFPRDLRRVEQTLRKFVKAPSATPTSNGK